MHLYAYVSMETLIKIIITAVQQQLWTAEPVIIDAITKCNNNCAKIDFLLSDLWEFKY